MWFFQMGTLKSTVKFFGMLLAVFIIAGCVAQKSENANTSEKAGSESSEKTTRSADDTSDRKIHSVNVEQHNESIDIIVQGNQKLVYTSIKQSFPFGIAVYLPGTALTSNFHTSNPDNKNIDDLIVSYADKEKKTIKIEILLNKDFDYEVVESGSNLRLTLSGNMGKDFVKTDENPATLPEPETLLAEEKTIEKIIAEEAVVIPDETAIITNDVRIETKVREPVPYRIVKGENGISLFFEPSTIDPPEFKKAKKKVISKTKKEEVTAIQTSSDTSDQSQPLPAQKKREEKDIFSAEKKYTGEKIKLDFYETDIKNVFRILRSVGKLNFAIDKNVGGKVTLTLENPVPWDQVLDLVLKMNSLGMKKEGNVIRIATLDSLKKEEKLLQDAIAAKQKSLEQKKKFDPLVTEYIPINYSDAEADVRPHIEQILTEERGRISVDTRTNMIILTDTQAKIDQAREMIYHLDRVTPQIMIEAKVVEVSKDFTRELGLGLTLTQSREETSSVGSDWDFTVALNSPVTAPVNSGDLNFWRILGSSYLNLNAQIAASEVKGDVKIVSSPRILTLDNKKATIKQGLEYAYLERDDSGGSAVKFKDIDLLLEVTPHVTPDKRIAMHVYITKNDIAAVTDGVPSLSTNEAETELLVNDSDTIVIGGIVKTSTEDSTTGTPILSDIPYIGKLFRTDRDKHSRNELLIFITPKIVQLDQKKNAFTSKNQ